VIEVPKGTFRMSVSLLSENGKGGQFPKCFLVFRIPENGQSLKFQSFWLHNYVADYSSNGTVLKYNKKRESSSCNRPWRPTGL
jgi:hypothetical protein